jgi:hypothetical protein
VSSPLYTQSTINRQYRNVTGFRSYLQPMYSTSPEVSTVERVNLLPSTGDFICAILMANHMLGTARIDGDLYIMEPNFGLYGFRDETDFVNDLSFYISARVGMAQARDQVFIWTFI